MLDDLRFQARRLRGRAFFEPAPYLRWPLYLLLALLGLVGSGMVAAPFFGITFGERAQVGIWGGTAAIVFTGLAVIMRRLAAAWSLRVHEKVKVGRIHYYRDRDFLKRLDCLALLSKDERLDSGKLIESYEGLLETAIAHEHPALIVKRPGEKFAVPVAIGGLIALQSKTLELEWSKVGWIGVVMLFFSTLGLCWVLASMIWIIASVISNAEQRDRDLLRWLRAVRHCRSFNEDPAPWLDGNGEPKYPVHKAAPSARKVARQVESAPTEPTAHRTTEKPK